MPERLSKVEDMIKKNLPKNSIKCFEGCVLYISEHCSGARDVCLRSIDSKFGEIQKSLENLDRKIDLIIGNGYGES